jgi:hypothetical protein
MPSDNDVDNFARNLLQPGFPFSLRDKGNKPIKIHYKISKRQSIDLMPILERSYDLCLKGKGDKAAKLISEITGLLIAAEIDLGSEYLEEIQVRDAMPRMLSQLRRELKKNVPAFVEKERESD